MSERAVEGQSAARRVKIDLIGGKVDESPGSEAEDGQYIAARFTRRGELLARVSGVDITATSASEGNVGDIADVPGVATQVGAIATAAVPAHTEGTLNEFSQDLSGDIRTRVTDVQGAPDAAAPSEALQVGAVANAVAPTPDEADMGAASMNLASELRVFSENTEAAHDAAAPSRRVVTAGVASTNIPTAVANGDAVNMDMNLYGRQRDAAYDDSSGSKAVTVVSNPSRNVIGALTFTQIDEPGDTAVTDITGFPLWCFQVVAGGTPLASTIEALGSHDNSNFFTLTPETTAKAGLAVANGVGTISAAGTYEWKGIAAVKYIKLRVMGDSGSPDAATFDVQLVVNS